MRNPAPRQARRIRLAQIIEPAIGGAKRHLLDLLHGLDRRRFDLSLIYSSERDPAFRAEVPLLERSGVTCFEVPMTREPRPAADLRALLRLARLFRNRRFDVVHAHASKAGLLARAAARVAGAPRVCYTPHVYAFASRRGAAALAFRAVEAMAAVLTWRVIVLTQVQAAAAISAGVARPGQLTVIPNGIDLALWDGLPPRDQACAELGLDPARPVAALAARLEARKRVDFLLAAASHALTMQPGIQFAIAGHGPEQPALERQTRRLGLESSVHFLGELPCVRGLYAAADVVCLASSSEGMPYALMEAMAARRPILATRVPGVEEMVPPSAGVLAPPHESSAFAQLLVRLLADAPLRERMGCCGREHVEKHWPLSRFIEAHEQVYADAAGANRRLD